MNQQANSAPLEHQYMYSKYENSDKNVIFSQFRAILPPENIFFVENIHKLSQGIEI